MFIDVENELNRCVNAIGGRLVRDLVGASPNFNNADYLFDDYKTVAELKILSVDQMREPNIRDKMSEIYREAFDRGDSNVIVYGEAIVSPTIFQRNTHAKLGKCIVFPFSAS